MSNPPTNKRPLSIIQGRDPLVLKTMLDFYAKPEANVLDVTANSRKMWKGVSHVGKVTYMDIDPGVNPDVAGDFTKTLPFDKETFDVVVFDPPHLPEAAGSTKSLAQYKKDYGLSVAPIKGDNISGYFEPFLKEVERVLKPGGLVFAKLKDFVHNHKYQWTLVDFVGAVRAHPGLVPCDLIVKQDPAGGNLKSGKWKKTHHVRNAHCWWVVVRKGTRCEGK